MPPSTVNSTLTNKTLHHQVAEVTTAMTIFHEEKQRNELERKIKWRNVMILVFLHAVGLYSAIMFPYREQLFLLAWIFIVGEFSWIGMSAGAHRLWSHHSFKATVPLRILLAISFYTTAMSTVYDWVRDHRAHHKYIDTEADPVNSRRGFFYSHVGWLMMLKTPYLLERGKKIDMSDILQDPVVQFFDRNYYTLVTFFAIILPVVIPVYFFNQDLKWTILSQVFMRYLYVLHAFWCVNSFAHMFGSRPFDKSITPTENIFISAIAGAEGWHNYHHTFPWDYRPSEMKKILFNTTTHWIELFEKVGLASDLKRASPEHVEKVAEAKGDGTRQIYGDGKHIQTQ